jgi:hypothetical protein
VFHKDAFGVMTQRAMSKIGDDLLRLIEPVMNGLVVGDRAAPTCGRWKANDVGLAECGE